MLYKDKLFGIWEPTLGKQVEKDAEFLMPKKTQDEQINKLMPEEKGKFEQKNTGYQQ